MLAPDLEANITNKLDYALRAASIYSGANKTTKFDYTLRMASLYSGANKTTKFDYARRAASGYSGADKTTNLTIKWMYLLPFPLKQSKKPH